MKRIKKIFFAILFIVIFSNQLFANKYLKDEYEFKKEKKYGEDVITIDGEQPLDLILKDASEKVKSGNPLDLVAAYKDYVESIGETINPDEFNHDLRFGDFEEDDEYPQIYDQLYKAYFEIEDNLKENKIPKNDNYEYTSEKNRFNNVIKIIITSIILILIIVCYIINRKKAILIFGIVILIYGVYSIFIVKQVEDKYDHISNYIINGIKDNHIVNDIDKKNDEKYKKEYIESISRKWDVSGLINGYMMDINYLINLKKSNNNFFSLNGYFENKKLEKRFANEQEYENYREDLNIWALNDMGKNLHVKNVPMLKYEDSKFEEMIDIITRNTLSYFENKKIFDNIDIAYINNVEKEVFFEDLIKSINNAGINSKNWEEDYKGYEELFIYFRNIYDRLGSYAYRSDFDNSVIPYFKGWYIDGESRDIELPYGEIIEYREPELVKKDIKEIVYTNERELDHDSKEKQVYVMYYKDSVGKLGATYTDIEFIKTGKNYEISFNPIELMYDIKKPTAISVVK